VSLKSKHVAENHNVKEIRVWPTKISAVLLVMVQLCARHYYHSVCSKLSVMQENLIPLLDEAFSYWLDQAIVGAFEKRAEN
jgi:hypothetical protein